MNVAKDPDAFRNFEYEGWQGAVDRYHESWSLVTRQTAGTVLDKLHVAEGCRFLDLGVRISSVGVTMLDLVWHPESAEAVFPAYLQGTARMGGCSVARDRRREQGSSAP